MQGKRAEDLSLLDTKDVLVDVGRDLFEFPGSESPKSKALQWITSKHYIDSTHVKSKRTSDASRTRTCAPKRELISNQSP